MITPQSTKWLIKSGATKPSPAWLVYEGENSLLYNLSDGKKESSISLLAMLEVAVLKSKIETDVAFNQDVWEMDVTIGCIGYVEKGSENCFHQNVCEFLRTGIASYCCN